MVPNSRPFLEAAFQRRESVARQSLRLLALLDDYGAEEQAIADALKNNTRADCTSYLHVNVRV
jgi:hypothetical protein